MKSIDFSQAFRNDLKEKPAYFALELALKICQAHPKISKLHNPS